MRHTYDVVVVGAGPAGGALAAACAKGGKRVALIESVAFGGTCPLRGCNPKKVLLAGAEAVSMAAHLQGRGLDAVPGVDWPALMAFKESFVEPIPERAERAYRKRGIDTFHGLARFTGPDTLAVDGPQGESDEFQAGHIGLCPGLRPADLPIPGGELCADSTDFLSLAELPRRMVFIGGGFVAMELASIAAWCGAGVTVLARSRPLKEFDPDLVDQLVDACRKAGMDLRLDTPTAAVERAGQGFLVRLEDGSVLEADLVVNAAGRVPDLEPLDPDRGGVEVGPHGVLVNEHLQSVSNPRVYAAGDAADTPLPLTPTAVIQARAAAANILGDNQATADHTGVPYVCFTVPPIAAAGLSEAEARERVPGLEVRQGSLAGKLPWKRLGETHGAYKFLVDPESDLLVGAHVMGHAAEELINTLALVIRGRIPLSTVRDQVWAYPTFAYELQYMLD